MDHPILPARRSPIRHFVSLIVIGAATAQALGLTLKMPTQLEANDISRWCTVWSLLERGTYAIDDCPWQSKTQDKVYKAAPFPTAGAGETPVRHFYSSKPPLLPTLIAGLLYPIRHAVGVPLHAEVLQERIERPERKEVEGQPGKYKVITVKPEPVKWPVFVLYLKPVIVLLNVVPLCVFLIFYARVLDRYAANDWAWLLSLFAAAWGTQLFVFNQTLNNHTVAAFSAFFAIYPLLRILDDGERSPGLFAAVGFFGAFCACNELPAALFGVLLFAILLNHNPRATMLYFLPAAAVPCAAFLATQYLAMGSFKPAYAEFGTESYNYEGSYWNTPLEFDWFDKHPESPLAYLFHMLLGHHGIFSLTPIFLFSAYALVQHLRGRWRRFSPAFAWMTAGLSVALLAFYTWKTHNYGGSTQGLRWLFWLFPFWLVFLPPGVEGGEEKRWVRNLSLAALLVSVFSIGYALRNPWSHPWILDMLEHLDMYHLVR